MNKKKSNCGICGELKVERRNRLVCLNCARKAASDYYRKNGNTGNPETQRETKAKYRNKIRPSGFSNSKISSLKKRYGISEARYMKLLQRAKFVCAICRGSLNNDPVVDHDHKLGKVREILCRSCNLGLGSFKDDSDILRQAAEYIEKHKRLNEKEIINSNVDDFSNVNSGTSE